jgi:hypothetical protein
VASVHARGACPADCRCAVGAISAVVGKLPCLAGGRIAQGLAEEPGSRRNGLHALELGGPSVSPFVFLLPNSSDARQNRDASPSSPVVDVSPCGAMRGSRKSSLHTIRWRGCYFACFMFVGCNDLRARLQFDSSGPRLSLRPIVSRPTHVRMYKVFTTTLSRTSTDKPAAETKRLASRNPTYEPGSNMTRFPRKDCLLANLG